MAPENFTNFGEAKLISSMSSSDMVLTVDEGDYFPLEDFHVVIEPRDGSNREIVFVASRTDNELTLGQRGLFGTSQPTHPVGADVFHGPLAHHTEAAYEHFEQEAAHPAKRMVLSPPSNEHTVTHNLNKYVSVTIYDSAGTKIITDVEYVSLDAIVIRTQAAFSGEVYLN